MKVGEDKAGVDDLMCPATILPAQPSDAYIGCFKTSTSLFTEERLQTNGPLIGNFDEYSSTPPPIIAAADG
jgi:hypothetical protein